MWPREEAEYFWLQNLAISVAWSHSSIMWPEAKTGMNTSVHLQSTETSPEKSIKGSIKLVTLKEKDCN